MDDNGGEVRIGTTEELMVAMAELPGPVYKLRVKPGIRHQESATSKKQEAVTSKKQEVTKLNQEIFCSNDFIR